MDRTIIHLIFLGLVHTAFSTLLSFEDDRVEDWRMVFNDPFPTCPDQEMLALSGMGIEKLTNNFIKSASIRYADLSGNRIKEIPEDAFKSASALVCLNLSRNHIPVEKLLSFGNDHLKALDLSYQRDGQTGFHEWANGVIEKTVLQTSSAASYPNVLHLDLSGNEFNFLSPDFGKRFPVLRQLYLNERNIGDILEKTFEILPDSLTSLHLERNWIKELHLNDIANIQALYLNGNPLSNTYSHILVGPKLKLLSLSNCTLRMIHPDVLRNVPMLEILDLSWNTISNVEVIANLTAVAQLKALSLSHNSFQEIPCAEGMVDLQYLSLSYNKIRQIRRYAGPRAMPWLKVLSLRGNLITEIDDDAFSAFPNLKELDLSHNLLKSLPPHWMLHARALQYLDLRHNHFSNIFDMSIDPRSNLLHIFVKSNVFKTINDENLQSLPPTCVLHVV